MEAKREPLQTSGDASVTVFGPHPLLSVTIEAQAGRHDDVHLHAGGQGVWVARMASELGARATLCGFAGGETGAVIAALLAPAPGEPRLVPTAGRSGCYVVDRREGERRVVAQTVADPPSRHELDDLFSTTCAAALEADVLVVCNPFPGDLLPLEVYANLVSDCEANGTPTIVDLSSPRLDSALKGRPTLVKLNDWELAEFVQGPIGEPQQMRDACVLLRTRGARTVVVTRGAEPAYVVGEQGEFELAPPRFERGSREGCGDTMVGALAARLAAGDALLDALVVGAAAGAANFLRHGLGSGSRGVVDELVGRVELRPL